MKYVGLTDDPISRRAAHGNPSDWWQRKFDTENEARKWEKEMLAKPGYKGGTGGEGVRQSGRRLGRGERLAEIVEGHFVFCRRHYRSS